MVHGWDSEGRRLWIRAIVAAAPMLASGIHAVSASRIADRRMNMLQDTAWLDLLMQVVHKLGSKYTCRVPALSPLVITMGWERLPPPT